MKKMIIATMLATAVIAASATEVGLMAVGDNNLDKNGVRVTASVGAVAGFTPQFSVTRIDNSYTRFAVGGEYNVIKVGAVSASVTAAAVYQDTNSAASGYGVTAGLKGTGSLTKNVDLVVGIERFAGQDRINSFNGTVTSVGLNVKF